MRLNARTGVLTGKPRLKGRYAFAVVVADQLGNTHQRSFVLQGSLAAQISSGLREEPHRASSRSREERVRIGVLRPETPGSIAPCLPLS